MCLVGLTASTRSPRAGRLRRGWARFRRAIEAGYTEALVKLADLFERRVRTRGQTVVVAGPEHRKAGKARLAGPLARRTLAGQTARHGHCHLLRVLWRGT